MTSRKMAQVLSTAALVALGYQVAPATVITQWSWPAGTTIAPPDNSPAATTGTGTATMLGMTNNYTYSDPSHTVGANAMGDVLDTSATNSSGTAIDEGAWRIRGGDAAGDGNQYNGPGSANGWNLSAPKYTQGAEFDASTAGYQNITLGFDVFSTKQGILDLQVQYNTNITNTGGWTNATAAMLTTPQTGDVAGGMFGTDVLTLANGWVTGITLNLSSVLLADNDANLGIRLVSDIDNNPADTTSFGTYANGNPATPSSVAVYNNNSGNWRFDNVTFSGAAVPEPASVASIGVAGLGLLARRNNRKKA